MKPEANDTQHNCFIKRAVHGIFHTQDQFTNTKKKRCVKSSVGLWEFCQVWKLNPIDEQAFYKLEMWSFEDVGINQEEGARSSIMDLDFEGYLSFLFMYVFQAIPNLKGPALVGCWRKENPKERLSFFFSS